MKHALSAFLSSSLSLVLFSCSQFNSGIESYVLTADKTQLYSGDYAVFSAIPTPAESYRDTTWLWDREKLALFHLGEESSILSASVPGTASVCVSGTSDGKTVFSNSIPVTVLPYPLQNGVALTRSTQKVGVWHSMSFVAGNTYLIEYSASSSVYLSVYKSDYSTLVTELNQLSQYSGSNQFISLSSFDGAIVISDGDNDTGWSDGSSEKWNDGSPCEYTLKCTLQ